MAHTFTAPNGTRFIHNGDFSGNVTIEEPYNDSINVPFEDLLFFVGEKIRARKIELMETENINKVLGI